MADPVGGAVQARVLARTSFRVAMADTDAACVIYFGAPILWAERLVTTWLADVGCGTWESLLGGYGLPAVHCEVDYASPLRLDDQVDAALWVDRQSHRSVSFRSEFAKMGDAVPSVVVRVTQVQAATDGERLRSIALMPKLAAALTHSVKIS